jgi:chloramphenicol 3-O-phosphotransferase
VIFVVSGSPGAGKSSVSRALAQRFPRGVHVPVDDLRELVVSGIAHPVPDWTDETTRQFRLARENAASIAKTYAREGFAVVLDDVIVPPDDPFSVLEPSRVLLRPTLETLLSRNVSRTNKTFDPSFLESTIRGLHNALENVPTHELEGWFVLDSSQLEVEETVDRILEHFEIMQNA